MLEVSATENKVSGEVMDLAASSLPLPFAMNLANPVRCTKSLVSE